MEEELSILTIISKYRSVGLVVWFLFNIISTPYGLSNAEIWFICKCLIDNNFIFNVWMHFLKIELFICL